MKLCLKKMKVNHYEPCMNICNHLEILLFNANNFRFKPGMISLLPNFHGLESESPYLPLKEFEKVCATFNNQTCIDDIVKLKLFHFSLKDNAKTWFNFVKPKSIGT